MILPRMSVVNKCMRDAVFYAEKDQNQDEPVNISPVKLLSKPQPPMALKKRKILKAEYHAFQVEETGMKGPPRWPPTSKMQLQYTIKLNGDGLGLELKSSQKPGGSQVRIVHIHEGGAAATSCPEIQVDDNLIGAGGFTFLRLSFGEAIKKLVQPKDCENGSLAIIVEKMGKGFI